METVIAKMKTSQFRYLVGLSAALFVLVGCNTDPIAAPAMPTGQVDSKVRDPYIPQAEAGVALSAEDARKDMDTVLDIANRKYWASRRSDAFALTAVERKFDQEQSLERLLSDNGGFMSEFQVPDEAPETEVPRSFPTPAWRLAGIVVSEGAVIALLDQGTRVDTIVPGQLVDGTEWRCISIDTDKAVFRRDPRRIPSEIVVPLQGGLPGVVGGGNAPAGNGGRGGRGGPAGVGPGRGGPAGGEGDGDDR